MKKTIIIISLVVVIIMMAATFVGKIHGNDYASQTIYSTWWFSALWALLTGVGIAYVIKSKLYKRPAVFLLHLSFVVILVGAFITHLTQQKAMMHLRQGFPSSEIVNEKGEMRQMNFQVRLDSFFITYKEGTRTHKDYTSIVTILPENQQHTISMNNILKQGNIRLYQADYDEDLRGSILIVNRDPWGIPVTYCGYLLMGISFILLLTHKSHRRLFGASLILAAFIAFLFSQKQYDMPVLNTWLLPVHVSLIIASYVLLFLAVWFRKLLNIALGMLAMGIFIGAYWANISWGTYWSWDPKEVWALITLLVYALPAHTASFPRFRNDKFYKTYMLLSFLCVLMTYLGVNYILGGMHSYGA